MGTISHIWRVGPETWGLGTVSLNQRRLSNEQVKANNAQSVPVRTGEKEKDYRKLVTCAKRKHRAISHFPLPQQRSENGNGNGNGLGMGMGGLYVVRST